MPMELPSTPFYRRWSFILASVVGMAAVVALVGWRGLQQVPTPPTTTVVTAPSTTQAPPTTTEPPPSIEPTSKPANILWERRNSHASKVRSLPFKATSGWRIEWAFDCSDFADLGGGNFKITGDGAFERQVQIENVAIEASGTRRFARGGFGHLRVESVCDRWTVTVLAG
jgi:hypothetical protein